jgi:hypothetical protein
MTPDDPHVFYLPRQKRWCQARRSVKKADEMSAGLTVLKTLREFEVTCHDQHAKRILFSYSILASNTDRATRAYSGRGADNALIFPHSPNPRGNINY